VRPSVCFYISGHGFGHASRQIEIINALGLLSPRIRIVVRTAAPPWLFDRTLRVPATIVAGDCDTGVLQLDSQHLDAGETIRRADRFYATLADRADVEAHLLEEHDVGFVVSDAPPLACAAAARAGVSSVVVSNFTWDWIYAEYAEHLAEAPRLLDRIQHAYGSADSAWRLPMHGGFDGFRRIIDVPFVARHATQSRDVVRARLGLPMDRLLVLSSFGGYGVKDVDLARLDCVDRYTVIVTHQGDGMNGLHGVHTLSENALYDESLRYEDLVGAVDVVLTKPGYGIISECLANETPMLYTPRGRFAEYEVLVSEMPRFLRCGFIDHEALFAGRWRDALDRLVAAPPPPERPATNGAEIVAGMILDGAQR
jgi:hypothetical protein